MDSGAVPLPSTSPTDAELGLDAILAEYGAGDDDIASLAAQLPPSLVQPSAASAAGAAAGVDASAAGGLLDDDGEEEDPLLADLMASAKVISAGRASIAAAAAAAAAPARRPGPPVPASSASLSPPSATAPTLAAAPSPVASSDPALLLAQASVCALAMAARAEAELLAGDASSGPAAAQSAVDSPLSRFRRRGIRGSPGGPAGDATHRSGPTHPRPGSIAGGASFEGQSSDGGRRHGSFRLGRRDSASTAEDDDADTASVASATPSASAEGGGADDLAGVAAPKGFGRTRRGLRLSCGRDFLQRRHAQHAQLQQHPTLPLLPKHTDAAGAASPAAADPWRTTITGVLGVSRLGRLSEQLAGFMRLAATPTALSPGIPTVIAVHPRFVAVGTSKGVVALFDSVRRVLLGAPLTLSFFAFSRTACPCTSLASGVS